MKVDGRCNCGQITFTAEVDPAALRICHCTDCQEATGSAFRTNIAAKADSFILLTGKPNEYVKTAESGRRRRQAFCGNCGSSLWSCAEFTSTAYTLRAGVLAQRASLTPSRQIWRRSAMPWVDHLTDVPASEKD